MSGFIDPSELVRQGYNKMASGYLQARLSGLPDPPLLAQFSRLLPAGSLVLDAGSGAGLPVSAFLLERHRVVALDFAIAQARLASKYVPSALVSCGDLTQPGFPASVFDGICSFYAILHIPRDKHRSLLLTFFELLRNDGLILLSLGANDIESDYGPYFGTRMYWSQFGAEEYLRLLNEIGFKLLTSEILPDPISKIAHHLFILARKVST
jgi:SAM-dependent methyltransferase